MPITTEEAREQILDDLAAAVERIAVAGACLGEAYEKLAVTSADRLESELFRPTQKALGRSKRAHAAFAEKCGYAPRPFGSASPGPDSRDAKDFIERAVIASADGDRLLAALQDSMLPIEFGDTTLRSGLGEVRESLAEVPPAAREFLRTLGR